MSNAIRTLPLKLYDAHDFTDLLSAANQAGKYFGGDGSNNIYERNGVSTHSLRRWQRVAED